MQRGVYFDGWFPNQHNYHPSLPPRRLRMIEELEDMKATMLVWSALGGGSVSLPYLEEEAYGRIPERFRMHGFVNDSEFIAHCRERGIEVFGVVFEAQGWEFPAELGDGDEVLALNETRNAAPRSWMGLREFTQDTGPQHWKPFSHYFPNGLVNSRGEPVTDLWDECTSRDIDGEPIRAHWVEAPDREHVAHFMDRNNPVWREYLKAIVRIQIDAGVSGVQLDESETPFGALGYGGCFCYDCMEQFRHYLQELPEAARPTELEEVSLDTFSYRQWLIDQGFTNRPSAMRLPLYQHYVRFNALAMKRHFREIATYIREYGRERGREVKVAGNFYNGNPEFDALVDEIDVLVTEMHTTRYAQPWWFRHLQGFGRGKDVLVVENPYGGIVPELVESLSAGRAYDRFRASIYEGAAMGPSMTFPYGSWLGSEIQDSFWAPKRLLDECGEFLATVDGLRAHRSINEVGVIFPVAVAMQAEIDGPRWIRDDLRGTAEEPIVDQIVYWDVIEKLSKEGILYDCIPLPDERERTNDVTAESLARYRTVIVPGRVNLSGAQLEELSHFAASGGRVLVLGTQDAEVEASLPGATAVATIDALSGELERQLRHWSDAPLAFNTHAISETETALHIVNYAYEVDSDAATRQTDLAIELRAPHTPTSVEILTERGISVTLPCTTTADGHTGFVIPDAGVYTVVRLR